MFLEIGRHIIGSVNDGSKDCKSVSNGYVCTKGKGHKGLHAAHGIASDIWPYAIWDDEAAEPWCDEDRREWRD